MTPAQFRLRSHTVDAVQHDGSIPSAEWFRTWINGADDYWWQPHGKHEAQTVVRIPAELMDDQHADATRGLIGHVYPGHWVLRTPEGTYVILSDVAFRSVYDRIPTETAGVHPLEQCARWFDEYAAIHHAKGGTEKAQVNRERAAYARHALTTNTTETDDGTAG